ncbi:hypothetical protein BZG05_13560 [Salinivibrio kushneri]|nr:hypothetical protein BZG05_13560 [Salinivibrio kushneri]
MLEITGGHVSAEEEYKKLFGLGNLLDKDKDKTEKALEHALDIRKFEINLYWERAKYFWALIAAAFAGYFAVLSADHMVDKNFNAFVISCVGLVFSLAWYVTNKGSKYWQENWENHVDMLEDSITGPLYKTILYRPNTKNGLSRVLKGPAPHSVSQINQWVSLFTVFIWFSLIFNVLPELEACYPISIKHTAVGIVTSLAIVLVLFGTKSNIVDGHRHLMSKKRTGVIDE